MKFLQGLGDDFYNDNNVYQGQIVPLGAANMPVAFNIPSVNTVTSAAAKTATQLRRLAAQGYVAQQTNSANGYAGATVHPFQVKEGLVSQFQLKNIPANILAKDVPEVDAIFDLLKYAVFTKLITQAKNKELRSQSGYFEGGPVPPLSFQQWLGLVDQALSIKNIPGMIAPIPVGDGSQQANDSGTLEESNQQGLSTGAMIGIGVGAVAVLGGIGFMIARRHKK
jgi:hypothetical protein